MTGIYITVATTQIPRQSTVTKQLNDDVKDTYIETVDNQMRYHRIRRRTRLSNMDRDTITHTT